MIEFDVFKKGDRSPDMTPMIDMVFLLLIFFLLTSVFQSTAIETDLPSSSTAHTQEDKPIVIAVKNDGKLYFNDRLIEAPELKYLLKCELENKNMHEVSIASDKNVDFQQIIALMDIARDSGAESVSFLTENDK
ncbi:Biopolymer transport protein ExbD/TolR [Denitrovibrio acetiphilus DSM 12809]|jgi:biopolymer transport protein ExbD|uniref:Biopolymer transport protein ExbD/TolR n=1 Tax=Denitrovibrio acetiphilus (strain DSM 12809 / NBRC 114555 / N2460) TaxID=522772 RepID=D4H5I8_DENA2|nr:biopolymer transporter ExbD [Denitrovibrio acetiphilus]ADD67608.1 Biopolymer transport protein ExbD/TolR [Denitrovibrio acetiphilus DSM 12809]